jgi:predicted membrane protein (TIGR00267 family)
MKWTSLTGSHHQLDLVAGLSDGILTALTLGAGHLLPGHPPMGLALALRIATAGAISGAFIFMVAHYAELRSALVEAERQLNLASHGRFATTQLGRAALIEAVAGALIASACTFCGALLPLLVGAFVPQLRWLSVMVALVALGVLGHFLARTTYGRPLHWVLALIIGGAVLALVGMQLEIA